MGNNCKLHRAKAVLASVNVAHFDGIACIYRDFSVTLHIDKGGELPNV